MTYPHKITPEDVLLAHMLSQAHGDKWTSLALSAGIDASIYPTQPANALFAALLDMDGQQVSGNRLIHAAGRANGHNANVTTEMVIGWESAVKKSYKLRDTQFEATLQHVIDRMRRNKLKSAMSAADRLADEDIDGAIAVLDEAKHHVQSLTASSRNETEEALAQIRAKRERIRQGEKLVVAANHAIPGIEYLFGDIRPHEMITLAARTSIGKTAFAVQWARANLERGRSVAYLSSEMPVSVILERLVCHSTCMRVNDLYGASERVFEDYAKASELPEAWIESGKLLCIQTKDLAVCRTEMRKHARRYGKIDLIIVDYLQAFADKSLKSMDERQRIAAISSEVQSWPHEGNFAAPVIALAQLNRDAEGKDNEPNISHIFGSSSLEMDSRRIMILHGPREGSQRECTLKQVKNSDGPTGRTEITFDATRGTFHGKRSADWPRRIML